VTEKELEETRASFYKKPKHDGRVCLVLGAGNVASIPPKDVALKMFTEGKVCILKMNPVNAYIGPFIEEAFAEPIKRGYLAVVYGGGEEGAYLTRHPGVDEIHITGSDKTHDMIVWGPPGPERAERMARNKPLIDKEITSELGNVSAVSILPGPYTPKQIAFQGEMIAGAITNNASFNCNAAKMLILPKGWDKREAFLAAVQKGLAAAPPRRAYYPGAFDRYKFLTEGRANVVKIGTPGQDGLPWTMVLGVDAASESERAFVTEPFCAIVSETELASAEPAAFLDAAVDFVNNKLWGTLNTTLVVHPELQKDPKMNEAIERAITKLRFGTVAINTWPAAAFALGTTAWGGHPSSTLTNIQSGRGFVGNSMMIERIEKCVLRHPLTSSPKPPTFPSHKTAHLVGRRISYLSEKQSWSKLPGLIAAALRG
jgi:aldehyde dehydrogenase (NAD(P)+)